ncbi:MAG: Double zinc ribbon [Firmicutes bacterium ADurb.Bin373]|nr:zinc-ribbon domain-containing protein [Bacillota bacterium]OQA09704.1 MAG: Double zinc ribbon [Firmicutes bacterium ADurb.Bin373]
MKCPGCHKALQDDFKFCPHCGTQIISSCNSCGKKVDPAWVSCPHCGASLRGRPNQQVPANAPPPPPPQHHYPQDQYQHGYPYGSSSRRHRKRGFLGRIFSS